MDRGKGEVRRSLECSVSIKCLSLWIEVCKMIWIFLFFCIYSISALSGVGVVNIRYMFMRKILFACERNDFSGVISLCRFSKGDIFICLSLSKSFHSSERAMSIAMKIHLFLFLFLFFHGIPSKTILQSS